MNPLLSALLLLPTVALGSIVSIEPAGISLDIPDIWIRLDRDSWPDAPDNVCFPRFDHRTERGRIDAVIWKGNQKLDEALDTYIQRILTPSAELQHKEVSREPFQSSSGVQGVKYVFQTTRQSPCGPDTWRLIRFIFRNSRGDIVCLGGFGDIDKIQQIVLQTLETK